MDNLEQTLSELNASLKEIGDQVKQTAETALKEAKNSGAVSAEVKAQSDTLLTAQNTIQKSVDALTKKVEGVEDRNRELEQELAAATPGGNDRPQSLGQAFAESDELKGFIAGGGRGNASLTVNNAITSADTVIYPDQENEPVRLPRRQFRVRQLLTQGRTGSNLVEYPKQTTRTNNAAPTAEEAQKPESDYVWAKADAPVRTIAHFIHISRQALDDTALIQTEIDSELVYGLNLVEETQLLNGDGTGENLSGLTTEAAAYSAEFAVTAETEIDKIRLAMLQASLAEYPADGIVLHPTDWARMELTKDSQERYIIGSATALNGPMLWNLPVVATQSLAEDKFLVGAFRTAATIYDRMDTEVAISDEDRDNFIKNMLTVRAEKRLAMAVKRPTALTFGDFGNVA